MKKYKNEKGFELHIRNLIIDRITKKKKGLYVLKSKKVADILICKDGRQPRIFFIEVKYHKKNHDRINVGDKRGAGFQPEILKIKSSSNYFCKHLRWVLSNDNCDSRKVLFLDSKTIRKYLPNRIRRQQNNIKKEIFKKEKWLDEKEFINKLKDWLKNSSQ